MRDRVAKQPTPIYNYGDDFKVGQQVYLGTKPVILKEKIGGGWKYSVVISGEEYIQTAADWKFDEELVDDIDND